MMDQKKPENKIYISRVELEKLLEFADRYEDCDDFALGASDASGVGQTLFVMTNYNHKIDHTKEEAVDESFRDITNYDAF